MSAKDTYLSLTEASGVKPVSVRQVLHTQEASVILRQASVRQLLQSMTEAYLSMREAYLRV